MSRRPTVRSGHASVVGGRERNEDSWCAADGTFLVADGMGGHEAGEVASATAIEALSGLGAGKATIAGVRRAIRSTHAKVRALPATGVRRPGTTVSGVVLSSNGDVWAWLVVNVGDSRTYRMAGGMLEQLTTDHSRVAELVAGGYVAPEEAAYHPDRHVLTRVLGGGSATVDPDVFWLPVSPGDRLLVCSDGLYDALPDGQVQGVLRAHADPQEASDALVATATAVGARDNVTVVVVDT
jgi:protein phosphatase